MKRGKFILTVLALYPMSILARIKTLVMRTEKGFKVASGKSRFGESYKMKGVTLNVLDIKVSSKDTDGKDTDGELAIF